MFSGQSPTWSTSVPRVPYPTGTCRDDTAARRLQGTAYRHRDTVWSLGAWRRGSFAGGQVADSQTIIEWTNRNNRSPPGYRDSLRIPEQSTRGTQMWRTFMLEECRLRFGNSASGRRGGLCGRRRGGVVAPIAMSGSIVLTVSDCPAAAIGVVVRRYLNVSNPRMIRAVALVELRVGCSPPEATGPTQRRKRRKTKPPLKCVRCYAIVAAVW